MRAWVIALLGLCALTGCTRPNPAWNLLTEGGYVVSSDGTEPSASDPSSGAPTDSSNSDGTATDTNGVDPVERLCADEYTPVKFGLVLDGFFTGSCTNAGFDQGIHVTKTMRSFGGQLRDALVRCDAGCLDCAAGSDEGVLEIPNPGQLAAFPVDVCLFMHYRINLNCNVTELVLWEGDKGPTAPRIILRASSDPDDGWVAPEILGAEGVGALEVARGGSKDCDCGSGLSCCDFNGVKKVRRSVLDFNGGDNYESVLPGESVAGFTYAGASYTVDVFDASEPFDVECLVPANYYWQLSRP